MDTTAPAPVQPRECAFVSGSGNDAPAQAFHDAVSGELHPALPFVVDRLAKTSMPADLCTLLRSAQAERDRLVAENLNLDAVLTRTENALHASRAQRDGLVAAYVGLIADCACAASSSKTAHPVHPVMIVAE